MVEISNAEMELPVNVSSACSVQCIASSVNVGKTLLKHVPTFILHNLHND